MKCLLKILVFDRWETFVIIEGEGLGHRVSHLLGLVLVDELLLEALERTCLFLEDLGTKSVVANLLVGNLLVATCWFALRLFAGQCSLSCSIASWSLMSIDSS